MKLASFVAASLLIFALVGIARPQQAAKAFVNTAGKPLDAVKLSVKQKQTIDEISARYSKRLRALQNEAKAGANVVDRRDALNREYTQAMIDVMTPRQRDQYLMAVYWHFKSFLRAHPQYNWKDLFVWGGAYVKIPPGEKWPP